MNTIAPLHIPGWLEEIPEELKNLPSEDGVPKEIIKHRHQMNLLNDCLEKRWKNRKEFYCGGNMFKSNSKP